MASNINLRVFKRSEDSVILFWNTESLNEDQKTNVTFSLLERESEDGSSEVKLVKELKVTLASSDQFNTSKDVAIGIIEHVANDISKDDSLLIKMIVGSQTKLDAFLRVSPNGVLPFYERDLKSQHSQLFCFDPKKKRWGKLNMVQLKNGSFALPVILVDEDGKIK